MWCMYHQHNIKFLDDKFKNSVDKIRNEYLLDDFVDERSSFPTFHRCGFDQCCLLVY